jgi:hypothetical protein
MSSSWFAVCPKCEKFYIIPDHVPTQYCAHYKDLSSRLLVKQSLSKNDTLLEKIQCKVIQSQIN